MMTGLRVSLFVVVLLIVKSYATYVPMDYELEDLTRQTDSTVTTRLNRLSRRLSQLSERLTNLTENVTAISQRPNVFVHAVFVGNVNPAKGTTLCFENVLARSEDTAYDSTTGEFTAPVGGVYWFAVYLCNPEIRWMVYHIYVNETPMTTSLLNDINVNCASANLVAELKPGDRVFVGVSNRIKYRTVIAESIYQTSSFSAALVSYT